MFECKVLTVRDLDFLDDNKRPVKGQQLWVLAESAEPQWNGYEVAKIWFPDGHTIKANPNAHPLFHSDRGFQYTNRVFYNKLQKAKMKQSMSRVAKCIDNGPEELVSIIENYITYYNNRRVQRNLGVLTPMEVSVKTSGDLK